MNVNRRRFERFALMPMYTPVAVRPDGEDSFRFEGHAYDISEGGLQFEIDEHIAPGTRVTVRFSLPTPCDTGEESVFATGNVVWNDDDDVEQGPVRIAVAFTEFATPGDHERLLRRLSSRQLARAA